MEYQGHRLKVKVTGSKKVKRACYTFVHGLPSTVRQCCPRFPTFLGGLSTILNNSHNFLIILVCFRSRLQYIVLHTGLIAIHVVAMSSVG